MVLINTVDDYATNGDNLVIDIDANEDLVDMDNRYDNNLGSITIDGENLIATSSTYTITDGADNSIFDIDLELGEDIAVSEGKLQFSITIEDEAGNTATFDQDDTTDFGSVTIVEGDPTVGIGKD